MRNAFVVALVLVGFTCHLSGCSDGRPRLGKLSGTVKYKGKPLTEGDIVFYPEEGRSAAGKVVDGEITDVTTYEPNDGAPVGKLKVVITAYDGPGTDMYAPRKLVIPDKYASLQTTDLSAEVSSNEADNEFSFELKD